MLVCEKHNFQGSNHKVEGDTFEFKFQVLFVILHKSLSFSLDLVYCL